MLKRIGITAFVLLAMGVAAPSGRAVEPWQKLLPAKVSDLDAIQQRLQENLPDAMKATVAVLVRNGAGSGVIVSPDGLVLTAGHVIEAPGRDVRIVLSDGRILKGKSLGTDRGADTGMIQIQGKGPFPFAPLGDLSQVRAGDWCFALGHPEGPDLKRGIVVRLGRVISANKLLVWSDCILLGGDSGGPLLDLDGRVIGINSWISLPTEANFHVPISAFQTRWNKLAAGTQIGNPTARPNMRHKRPEGPGVLDVRDRVNGAGVRDVTAPIAAKFRPSIVRIMANGKPVGLGTVIGADGQILTRALPTGESLGVVLADGRGFRAKQLATDEKNHLALVKIAATGLVPVKWSHEKDPSRGTWVVTPLPAPSAPSAPIPGKGTNGKSPAGGSADQLGIISASRRPIEREGGAMGVVMGPYLDGGVGIVKVLPKSGAAAAGLRVGDVVTKVNDERILNTESLRDEVRLHDPGEIVHLQVRRGDATVKIDVKLGDRVTTFDAMDRNMQMSPGTTRARSGFEAVIEHDTPLKDSQMGGPLVGLDGRVVGLNVARFDRAQTFAIPADLAARIAQQLILEVRYANPEPVKAFDITGTR